MPEPAAQVRAAWLCVILASIAGAGIVVVPAQRRLAAIESHAAQLSDLAARNEALIARLGALERTRDRVRADIRRLAGTGDAGSATAAMLRVIDGEAALHHVAISSVTPAAPTGAPGANADAFAVSLRGRYRDVVQTIEGLPHHDVLLEVGGVAVSRVAGTGTLPSVDAVVDATLYRKVEDVGPKGVADVGSAAQ